MGLKDIVGGAIKGVRNKIGIVFLLDKLNKVFAFLASIVTLFIGYQHLTGWQFLSSAFNWIVKRLMVALGIGFVTFKGVNFAASEIISYIKSNFLELPIEVLQILGLAKVDIAFNLVMAALMIKLYGMGINSARDSVSKLGVVK